MEKEVAKHEGKVLFYYIDIEKFKEVGEMLQISSVPHVFAVKGGEIVDEFQGVASDQHISEFYQRAASKWLIIKSEFFNNTTFMFTDMHI